MRNSVSIKADSRQTDVLALPSDWRNRTWWDDGNENHNECESSLVVALDGGRG